MTDDCWLWAGHVNKAGYGRYGARPAHRVVYESLVGPIPNGYEIDHLCRVTACINPEHLEAVTPQENKRRARKKICRRGHEYTPENEHWFRLSSGYMVRRCVECNRINNRDYQRKQYAQSL